MLPFGGNRRVEQHNPLSGIGSQLAINQAVATPLTNRLNGPLACQGPLKQHVFGGAKWERLNLDPCGSLKIRGNVLGRADHFPGLLPTTKTHAMSAFCQTNAPRGLLGQGGQPGQVAISPDDAKQKILATITGFGSAEDLVETTGLEDGDQVFRKYTVSKRPTPGRLDHLSAARCLEHIEHEWRRGVQDLSPFLRSPILTPQNKRDATAS